MKLLCRACAVTLGLAQLKLQMQFSYKNTAAAPELQEGQTEKTDTQYGMDITLVATIVFKNTVLVPYDFKTIAKHDKDVLLTEVFPIMRRSPSECPCLAQVMFCPAGLANQQTVMLR